LIDELMPLVGFHGRTDVRSGGVKSLGFIYYDVQNEEC